ncbi:MAG: FG-GAP-like repeat-containing protein [Pseudomonadota bacterium]
MDGPGKYKLTYSYEHFTIPDNFQIRYDGKNIVETGFTGGSETKSFDLVVQEGGPTSVQVIVGTNDEGTAWNYSVEAEVAEAAYLVFRETDEGKALPGTKRGWWPGTNDDVPGWDHVALYVDGVIYESHPGYQPAGYYDPLEETTTVVPKDVGVQAHHTLGSFEWYSTNSGEDGSWVRTAQRIEIPIADARAMAAQINTKLDSGFVPDRTPIGDFSPANQKGAHDWFTCVGLVEWAAEEAGINDGQGFIANELETVSILGAQTDFPTLSPDLLYNVMDGSWLPRTEFLGQAFFNEPAAAVNDSVQDGVEALKDAGDWLGETVRAVADPVDFIITDPLGRRFGYTQADGLIDEIPAIKYSGDGFLENLTLYGALPGQYSVTLIGLGENALFALGGGQNDGIYFDGFLNVDETRQFTFTYQGDAAATSDLTIAKTTPDSLKIGESFQYVYTVTNNGTTTANNVQFQEVLPDNIVVNNVQSTHDNGSFSASTTNITGLISSLAAGAVASITVDASVAKFGNSASTAFAFGDETDINVVDNVTVQVVTVDGVEPEAADLSLAFNASTPGGGGQVTLTLENQGPGLASDITVQLGMPAGVSIASTSPEQGTFDAQTGIWNVGNMRDGLTRDLAINFDLNGSGSTVLTAEVSAATETDPDSTPGNGNASEDDYASVNVEPFAEDFASNSGTVGSLAIGSARTGTIDRSGDTDWFRTTLYAGVDYQFDLEGSPTSMGTLSDPLLRLYDSNGTQVTSDDDDGVGRNSLINYTANSSGTYFLSAEAYSSHTGSYTLSASASARSGVGPSGDYNGDGTDDLGWFNPQTLRVGQWEMNNGNSSWKHIGTGGAGWEIAGVGDFDGDGTDDLLWFNSQTLRVGQWEMNNGSSTWKHIGTGGAGWEIAGVGDFDGDGTDDLLWFNPQTYRVGQWEMNNGSSTWKHIGTGGAGWEIAGVGDFNGDGTDDLLWYNPQNYRVGQWEMNNGNSAWSHIGVGSKGWDIAGTGDFNGDLTDDLLWFNPNAYTVGQWEMNNGNSTWDFIGTAAAGWNAAGTGDYDGDGTDDILWNNVQTGQVGQFEMNNGNSTWDHIGWGGSDWFIFA